MDENQPGELSPAETAYFESGGNAPLDTSQPDAAAQAAVEGQDKPKPEEVNTDGSVQVRDDKGRFVKTIPFDVFHAEREEHKRTKGELSELREFKGKMEERWRMLETAAQQMQQPPEPEDPEPDPNKDIFAHNAWLKRQLVKVTGSIAERDKQTAEEKRVAEEQNQAAEGERRVWNFWHQDAAKYKASNPEFDDVVTWASEYRSKQLANMADFYPQFADEAGITAQINAELRELVITAAKNGKSPAEAVHKLARSWGYQGKQNEPLKLPDGLAKVAAAQEASRTVGAAPGGPAGQEMSLEQIMSMPMPEFQAWYAEPKNARRYDKLMGA